MTEETLTAFDGFSKKSLTFLRNVRGKNSKPWFEAHRPVYEKQLMQPMRTLVGVLSIPMMTIDPDFETRPAVNRTISRIYRDTRFSKDKSLFRDSMWLTFKRPSKQWMNAPGFFFEITPRMYRWGMGFYEAKRDTMDKMRADIDNNPKEFRKVTAFYGKSNPYVLAGELYKRKMGPGHPEKIEDWYQRKSFYLTSEHKPDNLLFSPDLVDRLVVDFMMLKPLYQYLMALRAKKPLTRQR